MPKRGGFCGLYFRVPNTQLGECMKNTIKADLESNPRRVGCILPSFANQALSDLGMSARTPPPPKKKKERKTTTAKTNNTNKGDDQHTHTGSHKPKTGQSQKPRPSASRRTRRPRPVMPPGAPSSLGPLAWRRRAVRRRGRIGHGYTPVQRGT